MKGVENDLREGDEIYDILDSFFLFVSLDVSLFSPSDITSPLLSFLTPTHPARLLAPSLLTRTGSFVLGFIV